MFRPNGKRVLIEFLPEVEGSLILIEKEKPNHGIIVAKGDIQDVNVGDHVLFSKTAGKKITLDGQEYVVVDEENLLAILE